MQVRLGDGLTDSYHEALDGVAIDLRIVQEPGHGATSVSRSRIAQLDSRRSEFYWIHDRNSLAEEQAGLCVEGVW